MAKELIEILELPQQGPLMIALVGAGGKTTTMLALAQNYKFRNKRILVATTTRIYLPPEDARDYLVLGTSENPIEQPAPEGSVTVVGEGMEPNGKLIGVSPQWLDEVFEKKTFDVILVEADGSKGKPLKAPAEYEPVIPQKSTHVIGIIGMDAWGEAVNTHWVHRLEHFMRVTGCQEGQTIDGDVLMKLINSPVGLFKEAPPGAKRILLLNKCVHRDQIEAAQELIESCTRQGFGGLSRGVWR